MTTLSDGLETDDTGGRPVGWATMLRSLPAKVRLAVGRRGVLYAAAAVAVGFMCVVATFVDIASSLETAEVAFHRRKASEILQLDQSYRELMRNLSARAAGGSSTEGGDLPVRRKWAEVRASMNAICDGLERNASNFDTFLAICADSMVLRGRFDAEIAAFDPPRRLIDSEIMAEALMLSGRINEAGVSATRDNDALVDRMAQDYSRALIVLTLGTIGFTAAGLVLVVLVGRTSMLHHAAWQHARATTDIMQETLDALPAGVTLYDREERVIMFNKVALDISPGLAHPEAVGRTFAELAIDNARRLEASGYGRLDVEGAIRRFRQKGKQGQRQSIDGRWIDFSEQLTPSGRTVGLRVDVSEIKNRELEVDRARAEYQALVDSLSDMVVKIDIDSGEFTFVSAAAADLLGVPPDELLGVDVRDFIHPDDLQMVGALVRAEHAAADSSVRRVQFRMRRPDGGTRHVEVGFRKMPPETGRTLITGVFRDMSDSVELARRLEEETARLRSIVESSGALVLVTDPDLNILMVNREFRTFWGLGDEDLVGRSMMDTIGIGLDPASHRAWLSGDNTEPVNYSRVRRGTQGRHRVLSVTGRPIADEAGIVRQIVFLGVDDTERRDAEQALFDSERMATVGEMAATMAHEIAQPLQVINLATGSAQDELEQTAAGGGQPNAQYLASKLKRIAVQTERASRIIGELRSFVRGTADDQPTAFDPVTAMKSAVDLTRHALAQTRITVSSPPPDGLPTVVGHVERLEQVLVNLINNARDAGASTIDVTADVMERDDRRFVRIVIEDTGPGIAVDVLPRLFDSIVTTKGRGKGTGLGLRICRRIVEEIGGAISAANREEGGARFEILLPAAGRPA